MAELLSDLQRWAKYVDQGIRRLEYSVDSHVLQDNELDPNEALQKFQLIIDDARATKISAENDVAQLETMSADLKDLINTTDSEEIMKMDQDLKDMLNKLFPNKPIVEESLLVPANETEDPNVADGNSLVPPVTEPAQLSPQPYPEESFAEVEITPGLMSKVPKSRVETGDLLPLSQRCVDYGVRPLRKRTLVFSPENLSRLEQSPGPETSTPQVLQDRTNVDSTRAGAHNSELEKTIDSPEILQRPSRPVLKSQLDGL